jgi:hypothetical protein
MTKRQIWLVAIVAAILMILVGTHCLPPQEICETTKQGRQINCASYSLPLFVWIKVGQFIENHEPLITALSGTAVAIFTAVLAYSTHLMWQASTNQLAHSEDTAKRQLRAYVATDGMHFEIKSVEEGYTPVDTSAPAFVYPDNLTIRFKNFGTTPASRVTAYIAIQPVALAANLPADYDYETPILPKKSFNIETRHFLQSGQAEPIKFPLLDISKLWAARRRECSAIIFGRVYYLDAFDRPHSTMFCFSWEPWHPHGERFVPLDRFNGEDEKREPALT